MDGPLVRLIQNDDLVLHEVVVCQTLSQQHTIGHVLDLGVGARDVLETHRVTDLLTCDDET